MSLFSEAFTQRAEKAADKTKRGASRIKNSFGRGNNVSPQEELQKPTFTTPEFKKNYFVDRGVTTDAEVKGKRRETNERSEWVQFSDSTNKEVTTFLDNYVTNLHHAMKDDSTFEDILKAQPHTEQIYKLLSEGVFDEDRTADDAKLKENIKKMLDKPSGWVLAKELMEQETAMGLMALGLVTSEDMGKSGKLRAVGEYLGLVDKKTDFNNDPGSVMHRNIGKGTGGSIGAVVGGGVGNILSRGNADFWSNIGDTMANIPHGSVAMSTYIGAGVGAVLGSSLAERRRRNQDAGTNGVFEQNEEAKNAGKALPKEVKDYLKKLWKVDVDDLQNSEGDVRDIMGSLAKNIKTRESYFDDLGIPKDVRDLSPESKIIGKYSVARSGERITQKILAVYKEKGGSTHEQYREARVEVLGKLTQELIAGIESKPKERPLETIKQKIADRQEGGRIYESKKQSAVNPEELEQAKLNVSTLDKEVSLFSELHQKTGELPPIQSAKSKIFSDVGGASNKDQAVAMINEKIFGADPRKSDPDAIDSKLKVIKQEYEKEYSDLFKGGPSKESHEALLARISPDIDRLNDKYALIRKPLLDERDKWLSYRGEIESLSLQEQQINDQIGEINTNIKKFDGDYNTIKGWLTNPDDLKDKSIDELLQTINKLTPPAGWPEEENENSENIAKLWRAKIEAKAIETAASRGVKVDNNIREEMLNIELLKERRTLRNLENSANTVDLSDEIETLEVRQDLLKPETQARIFGKSKEIIEKSSTFFDTAPIDPSVHTQAEKDYKDASGNNPPNGYFELLNMLFDYRKRSDSEDYFKKISAVVPPEDFITILRELAQESGIDLRGAKKDSLVDTFKKLEKGRDKLSRRNMRKALERLLDGVEASALAMS